MSFLFSYSRLVWETAPKKNGPENLPNAPTSAAPEKPEDVMKEQLAKLDQDVTKVSRQKLEEMREQNRKLGEIPVLAKIENYWDNTKDRFDRMDGAGKAIALGSIALMGYLFMKSDSNSWAKKIAKMGGLALGADVLYNLATGKSLLETLGLMHARNQLPAPLKTYAETIGMKEGNEALALVKLADRPMSQLWRLRNKYKNEGSIPPVEAGFFNKEVSGTELFKLIDGVITNSGSESEFEKKFVNGPRQYTFMEVVASLYSYQVIEQMAKISGDEDKIQSELRTIFTDARFHVDGLFVELGGFKLPGFRASEKDEENVPYKFTFGEDKILEIGAKDSPEERSKKFELLIKYQQEALQKRMVGGPFAGYVPEFRGDRWVLTGAKVEGKPVDIDLRMKPEEKNYKVEYYIQGIKLPENKAIPEMLYSFQLMDSLRTFFPVFRGIKNFEITSVQDGRIEGIVEGAVLRAHVENGIVMIDNQQDILKNYSFMNAKKDQLRAILDDIFSGNANRKIANKADDANENFFGGFEFSTAYLEKVLKLSGNVSESAWGAAVTAKMQNILDIYGDGLAGAKSLQEAGSLQETLGSTLGQELKGFFDQFKSRVDSDKEFNDGEFENYLKDFMSLGFASEAARNEVKGMMSKFYTGLDYEGLDKMDRFSNWYKSFGSVINRYLSYLAPVALENPLSEKGIMYIHYVGDKMFEDLQGKTISLSNMPIFNIDSYESFNTNSLPKLVVEKINQGTLDFIQDLRLDADDRGPDGRLTLSGVGKAMNAIVENAEQDVSEQRVNHNILNTMLQKYFDEQQGFQDYKEVRTHVVNLPTFEAQRDFLKHYQSNVQTDLETAVEKN